MASKVARFYMGIGFFFCSVSLMAGGNKWLEKFDGYYKEKAIQLHWQSAAEGSSDEFHIQHSVDGQTFYTVSVVKARFNNNTDNHYQYVCNKLSAGNNFYRVLCLDETGVRATSENFEYFMEEPTNTCFNEYQYSKGNNRMYFKCNAAPDLQEVKYELFDHNGKQIWDQSSAIKRENTQAYVQFPESLPDGKYIQKAHWKNTAYTTYFELKN